MGKLLRAAQNAINVCVGLKEDENILFIYDSSTRNIFEALESVARDITHGVYYFDLDSFKRPLKNVPKVVVDMVKKCDICLYLASSLSKELPTFRRPLRLLMLKNKVRYAHMPNVTKKVFCDSVGVDYDRIWEFTDKVYSKVSKAKQIRVVSDKGTDLVFSKFNKWVKSDGNLRKFSVSKLNLPGAEVMTCPGSVDGTLVVDGLISGEFTKRYKKLKRKPLIVEIKKGKVFALESRDEELVDEFWEMIKTDKNSNRIGEIGFGTNIFLKKYYYNFLVDEKFPGVHIAVGNPYPERTGAKWKSSIHYDMLIRNPTVYVGKEKVLNSGKYLL